MVFFSILAVYGLNMKSPMSSGDFILRRVFLYPIFFRSWQTYYRLPRSAAITATFVQAL